MVAMVLRHVQALNPHTKRPLLLGLLLALVMTVALVVGVVTGFLPAGLLGILAGVGMGALVLGDLRRGDGTRTRRPEAPPLAPRSQVEAKVPQESLHH